MKKKQKSKISNAISGVDFSSAANISEIFSKKPTSKKVKTV